MENQHIYDIVVIGGGINGVGIAADAQGRNLRVLLCEKDDLANATSSKSSKLIHGGLRYLAQYDFALVRNALKERTILQRIAPHLVHPLRFIIPCTQKKFSDWRMRIGLYLYDLMGSGNTFSQSGLIRFDQAHPLSTYQKGFFYSDAQTDDARLVIANALRFKEKGGTLLTRTQCIAAKRIDHYWQITLRDLQQRTNRIVKATALVNAAGPWVDQVIKDVIQIKSRYQARLVKGSHIVVKKFHDREEAFLLPHHDGRVVFVIPYFQDFTLIGTTDVEFCGEPHIIDISQEEIHYLTHIVNGYFKQSISSHDILHSWSGVRSLVHDHQHDLSKTSREYKLELDKDHSHRLPLLNVFGGKLTTYRKLAEQTVDKLMPFFPQATSRWTHLFPLPGGDLPEKSMIAFVNHLYHQYPKLPHPLLHRYAHSYGTYAYKILENVNSTADLGNCVGADLHEKEIDYLIQHEWAQTAEDILWRRTKCGMLTNDTETIALQDYMHCRTQFKES